MMQSKYTPKKSPLFVRLALLTVPLALLLLSGCATPPAPPLPLPVKPAQMPQLPGYAKQPPMPPECSPTCERNLTSVRESWLARLMTPTLPAPPASAGTPKFEKP
jgi:hypothetical protein